MNKRPRTSRMVERGKKVRIRFKWQSL